MQNLSSIIAILGIEWVLFCLAEIVFPAKCIYGDSFIVYFYFAVYYIFMAVPAFAIVGHKKFVSNSVGLVSSDEVKNIDYLILTCFATTIAGFMLLFYNRVFLQQINYSSGIAEAREQWKTVGLDTGTSIFGILGNVFLAAYLPLTCILLLKFEVLKQRSRVLGIISIIIGLGSYSVFSGGRTPMLITLTLIISMLLVRWGKKLKIYPGKAYVKIVYVPVIVIVALGYTLYVFDSRSKMNNIDPSVYAESWIYYLGGEIKSNNAIIESMPEFIEPAMYHSITTGAYLLHSIWSFQTILESKDRPGSILLTRVRYIASRFGIGTAVEPWLLNGFFIPLPGAALYDFGIFGMLITALLHGCLLGWGLLCFSKPTKNLLLVCASGMIMLTTIIAPMGFAPDMLIFPFFVTFSTILELLIRASKRSFNFN
jgi:hypothetical protein